jgi:hypothetical protein
MATGDRWEARSVNYRRVLYKVTVVQIVVQMVGVQMLGTVTLACRHCLLPWRQMAGIRFAQAGRG